MSKVSLLMLLFIITCSRNQEKITDDKIEFTRAETTRDDNSTATRQLATIDLKEIRSYCLDFNWGFTRYSFKGGSNYFAPPGLWAEASPRDHINWYANLGVNTIQTFAISCNGYAWYKNGIVPEQPGLKFDFLKDIVQLGHEKGIKVMGYFCIGSNTRWGKQNPTYSYGYPSNFHIPYTDKYLAYLDAVIRDALIKTDMDGFMIDWVWQPNRKFTKGKWLDSEKELYENLMKKPFSGEAHLSDEDYLLYSRLAIARCWKTIYKAAKETNPNSIIWLSCAKPKHPHVINSEMFEEVDWWMNEAGDIERIEEIKEMIDETTKLITCLASYNKQNPMVIIPAAKKAGIGLYGYAKPSYHTSLRSPISYYLSKPLDSYEDLDDKNIAALARIYNGFPLKD